MERASVPFTGALRRRLSPRAGCAHQGAAFLMLAFPAAIRIYVAIQPVDPSHTGCRMRPRGRPFPSERTTTAALASAAPTQVDNEQGELEPTGNRLDVRSRILDLLQGHVARGDDQIHQGDGRVVDRRSGPQCIAKRIHGAIGHVAGVSGRAQESGWAREPGWARGRGRARGPRQAAPPGVKFTGVTFTPRAPGDGKYPDTLVAGIRLTTTDRRGPTSGRSAP